MKELWVEARGFPRYDVSTYSLVWDRKRECLLAGSRGPKGRHSYYLVDGAGINRTVQAHRLAYASFFDWDIPEGVEINHIDGDPSNNALWNLEEMTHEQNQLHANRMGLRHPYRPVVNFETGIEYPSVKSAADSFGLDPRALSKALNHGDGEINGLRFERL